MADVALKSGESTITREMNRRHLTVKLNLRGRDLSSFLDRGAGNASRDDVQLRRDGNIKSSGAGSSRTSSGRRRRLAVIMPIVLALIFLLLYGAFGDAAPRRRSSCSTCRSRCSAAWSRSTCAG